MSYTNKNTIIFQDLFDIKNINYSPSTASSTLYYVIEVISNYYIEKKDFICILDYKVKLLTILYIYLIYPILA